MLFDTLTSLVEDVTSLCARNGLPYSVEKIVPEGEGEIGRAALLRQDSNGVNCVVRASFLSIVKGNNFGYANASYVSQFPRPEKPSSVYDTPLKDIFTRLLQERIFNPDDISCSYNCIPFREEYIARLRISDMLFTVDPSKAGGRIRGLVDLLKPLAL